ncbi:uncharacterized protein PAE49_006900 isoform 2-T2 [Odontesthes bonariensis]|uniref:uncharacterized protein LOC142382031 isoform X2 n=1 Tax=Odontesthes bonariensis TaxID=219752 RepID=UPI003F58C679
MSSGFPTSELQSFGLPNDIGAPTLPPPKNLIQTQEAADTHSTSLRLRFNSLSLDELSDELDRRTKETQRLQEEVENATRIALERFGCSYGNTSPGQSCHNHDSSEESTTLSAHQQAVSQPLVCSLDTLKREVVQRDGSSSENEALENAIDNCLQQLSDLQLNKTRDQPEQDTFNPQGAVMNLHIKLHEVQMEKDVLSDLRLKDSRKHVDQMEKMLCMLEELQSIKRSADQKLQETEDEALALHRKVAALEQTIKGMYHTLCGHNSVSTQGVNSQTQQSLINANEDLNNNTDKLQDRQFSSKGPLGTEEYNGVNKQERMEDVITSVGQGMATLTEKLSSSTDNSSRLCDKLELLKKLSERQTSLHRCQISKLESTLSSYKDKVCCLQQELLEAQTQLLNTQREKEQSLQQAQELHSQLEQLKRCCVQQQLELHEDTEVLRGQLEMAREQFCKTVQEKASLQALLEQRAQEKRESQELLQEKHEELHFRQQETQKHLARLEEAQSQCQTLQAEQETSRLKLSDRQKMIDVLRLQTESSIQMTVQHSHKIDSLQQENSLLISQLNQHKLEIQQLTADLVHHKSDLAAVERERQQLQASVTEHLRHVREETLEKQNVSAQLELQHIQLLTLTKEHKELQLLHSCKNDEHEGVVTKLQSQLRSAHDELEKIRHTLRTFHGADGHGLKVAFDMQKEITARREQVDSLQGKIQHLEENMEKLQQEKRFQNLETQRQLQELAFIREEKRQLNEELKTLRSKDQQLRERISELEAILHKMTESFANCQDFLQLRDQEYFRLKLQHALDLKELQGQNLCTAPVEPPPDLDSPTPSARSVPPSSQRASDGQIKRQQESCAGELRSLVKELRGVISQNRRPHTDKSAAGSSFHRRRSAPGRESRTTLTDSTDEVKAGSRLRRKTCGSEPRFLRTAEPNRKTVDKSHFISSPATAAMCTRFPQLVSQGRRSPVHSLLTSDPNS